MCERERERERKTERERVEDTARELALLDEILSHHPIHNIHIHECTIYRRNQSTTYVQNVQLHIYIIYRYIYTEHTANGWCIRIQAPPARAEDTAREVALLDQILSSSEERLIERSAFLDELSRWARSCP